MSKGKRPVVAVTGPEKGGMAPWLMTRIAVARAGGRAVRVHAGCYREGMDFDGLILGGGSDISPHHYGQELITLEKTTRQETLRTRAASALILLLRLIFSVKLRQPEKDPRRDELEKNLLKTALDNSRPVLGICRGAQMINVSLGGTLYQDTSDFYTETPNIRSIRPVKDVTIEEHSHLRRILGVARLRVNSLHNQAVDRLGDGLEICARDSNGVVQAIESRGASYLTGVQWHPEYLPTSARHQRLFAKLVAQARGEG